MNEFATEKHFNKIFVLHDNSTKRTSADLTEKPLSAEAIPQDNFLSHLKERLNSTKSLLNHLNLDEWHQHTRTANPAGRILWHVRNACNPELLTQAWLKFYQILECFSLVSEESKHFSTLHLCEAPGAFVTALNHHLQNNFKDVEWSWRASSLNPHHEGNPGTLMVSDDRFLVKTLDHWDFGPDATGDILAAETGRHLSSLGPFDLVTADGSIDCQDDPGEQEMTVATLLAAETITALASLKQGGNFVLKTFTWFENSSVSLLYLLCCSFGRVSAVKPVASKEGNSEIYVVCQSFKGLSKKIEVLLWTDYSNQFVVPENFIVKVRDASLYFLELQIDAIEKNLSLFESGPSNAQKKRVRVLQNSIANRFLEQYNLLSPVAKLVAPDAEYSRLQPLPCPWTFAQMQSIRSSLRNLKSSEAKHTLQMLVPGLKFTSLGLPVTLPKVSISTSLLYGRSVEQVTCSKFCTPWLLQLHHFCHYLNLLPLQKTKTDFAPDYNVDWRTDLCEKLSFLQLGRNFCVENFQLLSYLQVGILCLLMQQFEKTVLENISPRGCFIKFVAFKGLGTDLKAGLSADSFKDRLQLLQVTPLAPLLYGDLHPLVEQANQQTVLRLAQATLALLPENIEVTD